MEIDGKALRREMAGKNFTVVGLARTAGITAATLNKILNHSNKARIDTLGKLAKALGVDIYDIAREA
ncbi:helix-turn-helix transcriptional regulator [Selenomonas sp. AB3002]|uniref:helix-turn-helix domain-containing protein n=1 Tax=Selenomonas sp. AB3002 TaxID=1392502 RepID=UPI000495C99A